ncbi:long-chain-fatty-acid--CoA ligase [Bryobacterales bacterium F-183]|nr:long-chain-fatty-acid--CoA ligase [Bryobacterales bacterium F-183]
MSRTLFTVLEETAAKYGDRKGLFQPVPGLKKQVRLEEKYQTYTWNEFATASREIGAGLLSLGVAHGDIVATFSETRAEFYLADFGIFSIGAISAGLYTSIPMEEQAETLRKIRPVLVFAENAQAKDRLCAALGSEAAASIQWVLLTDGGLDELRKRGRANMAAFAVAHARVKPADTAVLYLTSGATGAPKMGLVSHASAVANADMPPLVMEAGPEDRAIAFLPSAHIAQRVAMEFMAIRMAFPIYFSESLTRLPLELKAIQPTILLAPPRVWERMYATIATEIRKRGAVSRRIFYAAVGAGAQAFRLRQEGKEIPAWLAASLKVFDRLVYSKIRERLGGQLRLPISGSAPLGKDLADFFGSIGLPILEGFGLTEGGVTTLNPVARPKSGSIGKMLPGVEAKLAEDGELLLGGPTIFNGYYEDTESTAAVLRDGWLHTGDIARVDEEGYWYITGRKKEIIVASNGKKIYPARIENLFKSEPIVNQMVLIGDKLPYITAIFTVRTQAAEALDESLKGASFAEISKAEPVVAELQKAVQRANRQLPQFEQIRKYKVLDREFSIEAGEVTPTMKVRRAKVLENHRDLVSELYTGKDID